MTIEDVIAFNVTILLAIVNFPYTLKKIFEPSSKCYNMITNFNIPMVGYHLKQGADIDDSSRKERMVS